MIPFKSATIKIIYLIKRPAMQFGFQKQHKHQEDYLCFKNNKK